VTTDTYLSQRLGAYRTALREFESGADNAVAQFKRSGAPASATAPAPRPQPVVQSQPVPQAQAARVAPLRNDPFLNLSDSLKTDGHVAMSMVNDAVSSRSPEKINQIVHDLEAAIPKNPTAEQAEHTLRAVQAIRAQNATGNLTDANASALRSLESRFITPERNPVGLASNGKWEQAAAIYRERLANGWQREVVERDIRQQIRNATMMRDSIIRSGARQKVKTPNATMMWDRIIESNESILRDLNK
jgi:hypothetical protein